MPSDEVKSWVFVSHASEDIAAVRQVRNHLESAGASPLLFHLKALTRAKEFWPLIDKEIRARSFFLYCESAAAERSEWVRRERIAVEKAAKRQAKRIGRIRVDAESLDLESLNDFVARTRVYFAHIGHLDVEPYRSALKDCGFQTDFGHVSGDLEIWREMDAWHFEDSAKSGWVLVFLTPDGVTPSGLAPSDQTWAEQTIRRALRFGADRVVPVLSGDLRMPPSLADLVSTLRPFDPRRDHRNAPSRLARELLTR